MSGKLEGKIAIVTGGSTGIGLATAKEFVAQGAYVFITGRRQAELDKALKEIGSNATAIRADSSSLSDLDKVYDQIKQEEGRIDIVFANAGIGAFAPLGSITEEHFDSIFDTNVKGLVFSVQQALPLIPDGGAVILNASIASIKGTAAFSICSATKAAVRKVVERDLNATALTPINAEWVGAVYTPEEARTPQQKALLSHSDALLAELEQGDEYVFGVPMHNFGVPSVLKLWIDQIVRVGRTFSYADGRPKGLIIGKKATFIIATGGIYDAQTQMASFNFVEPYLRSVFGFLGVTNATFLTAGGSAVLNQGQDRSAFLAPHLQAVQARAQRLEEVAA